MRRYRCVALDCYPCDKFQGCFFSIVLQQCCMMLNITTLNRFRMFAAYSNFFTGRVAGAGVVVYGTLSFFNYCFYLFAKIICFNFFGNNQRSNTNTIIILHAIEKKRTPYNVKR